jgi:preprotein translocase subunit SecF
MRSINTSLTSLLPVGSLLFIGSILFGAGTLREFALALFVGIGAGTYSSIFIAAPLLALWKERETEWSRRRYRAERKAAGRTASGAQRGRPGPAPGRLSSRGQRTPGGRTRPRKR